jgi:hypothetical protein
MKRHDHPEAEDITKHVLGRRVALSILRSIIIVM